LPCERRRLSPTRSFERIAGWDCGHSIGPCKSFT
jgi:hypothetical protein